jgi:4-diphosphocytidyl-2-C-methyl-D-erythritol kinase
MKALTEKSYTRITLALDIVRKVTTGHFRGYHELSLIKHRIGLYDTITVEEAKTTRIACSDPRVPLDDGNICMQSLAAIKKATGIDKNVAITIEKNIPVMGGLAGGSANAATTIKLLNRLWGLGIDNNRMMEIGRTLGMDVPYFFSAGTAFDSEAGGALEPIATACRFHFLLVVPGFGVSTAEAYRNIDYGEIAKNLSATRAMRVALENNDCRTAIELMHNDFELSVFKRCPELGAIKKQLLDLGCVNAAMTGSGSTVLGIVDGESDLEKIRSKLKYATIDVGSLE